MRRARGDSHGSAMTRPSRSGFVAGMSWIYQELVPSSKARCETWARLLTGNRTSGSSSETRRFCHEEAFDGCARVGADRRSGGGLRPRRWRLPRRRWQLPRRRFPWGPGRRVPRRLSRRARIPRRLPRSGAPRRLPWSGCPRSGCPRRPRFPPRGRLPPGRRPDLDRPALGLERRRPSLARWRLVGGALPRLVLGSGPVGLEWIPVGLAGRLLVAGRLLKREPRPFARARVDLTRGARCIYELRRRPEIARARRLSVVSASPASKSAKPPPLGAVDASQAQLLTPPSCAPLSAPAPVELPPVPSVPPVPVLPPPPVAPPDPVADDEPPAPVVGIPPSGMGMGMPPSGIAHSPWKQFWPDGHLTPAHPS